MDSNGKASKSSDVIISIHGEEKLVADSPSRLSNDSNDYNAQKSVPVSCPSPEIAIFMPSPNKLSKTPKNENIIRRKSLARSAFSKPKSRFGDGKMYENDALVEDRDDPVSNWGSPSAKVGAVSPKTPLMSSPGGFGGVDKDEEIYKKVSSMKKMKHRKFKAKVLIKWFLFLCILACLVVSLTVDSVEKWEIWHLKIWRWCLLVFVIFSGRLVTKWLMHFVVLYLELNYLLKKKVLYFMHGLKKSVQVCIWLGLVLLTWVEVFQQGAKWSHNTTRVMDFVSWSIASLLIGSLLWVLKTLLLKILASSFHVTTIMEAVNMDRLNSFVPKKKGKEGKEKREEKKAIDINKIHQMKQDKVSAWTMKMLVDMISSSGLSLTTLSNQIDESYYNGGNEQTDKEITNEEEAIAAAYHIFRNVAKPDSKHIDVFDLSRFLIREEVEVVFPMIDVAEAGQIDRTTLIEWVLQVYQSRKALAHALNDIRDFPTAVKQLDKLVTCVLIVIMIVVWLLLTGVANTKVLIFLSSQLVLTAFVFGNTCKTISEVIIFVFVMHPFDVGDRCIIDGVQMIVEEMNILSTIFLRFDNEKICYPNSVLATKWISNFFRSPDMGDLFEFSIDFKTHLEKIGSLKERIKKYLEKNPQYWYPNHNLVAKEVEDVNKIKMALFFNHTMNFQNYGEKSRRRSELVLEMKRIFEDLKISCDLLPQEVRLSQTEK